MLCTVYITVDAQNSQLEYRPFAKDGKAWETQVGGILENIYGNRIDGDTVINGENWKKVYNYVGFPEFNYTYFAAICDEGKKVYAIAKGSNRPRLLYDFDLKEGNTIKCGVEGNAFGCLLEKDEQVDTLLGFPFKSYLRVERIDTITARGLLHRRFTLSLLDAFYEYYRNGEDAIIEKVIWIEGVGSGSGPFSPWMPLPPKGMFLESCYIDKDCIFGSPDFYDAQMIDAVNCPYPTSPKSTPAYDLQGRPQLHLPAKGVYIRQGRKVVR